MKNQAPKPADAMIMAHSEHRACLLKNAREASISPGIYLMKDHQGAILYVGKAKNLRNRLSTYFQAPPHEVARTEMLVHQIDHFEVILTETEAEALILECTLIKKHKPKFNVRLKDDKAYPYLKIQIREPFPRIEWTRRVKKDEALYFGPFPSAWSARQVMELLNETFQLRDCSDNTFRHRSRPCILHQMKKCTGPCVALVTPEKYGESIQAVVQVLQGKDDSLIQTLRRGMNDAAEREEYELAAEYRDQIHNIELITATQVVDEAGTDRNRDVVAIARSSSTEGPGSLAHGVLLQIRGGRLMAVRHYNFQNTDPSLSDAEILSEFLAQYYLAADQAAETELQGGDTTGYGAVGPALARPQEVLLADTPENAELLQQTLGLSVRIAQKDDNPVVLQLLNVARTNAQYALEQNQKQAASHGIRALEDVQRKLHLQTLPTRIECYDISNIQGEDPVASRVVFIDGAPEKHLYRRYKIKTIEGSNDFAMMKEVLGRRFSHIDHNDETPPHLVIVDGGKGQLAQAIAIFEEFGIKNVALAGLAKARVESDFQATEVNSSLERVFIPNRKNPIPLLPHTDAYKLLTHVRDEAHRFAISYHRLVRSKRSLKTQTQR